MVKNSESLIINIYNSVIAIVLKDIGSKYHQEVSREYYRKLKIKYSNNKVNESTYDLIFSRVVELEKKEWLNMPANVKLSMLTKDSSLEELSTLSNMASNYAKNFLDSGKIIDEDTYNSILNKFSELKESVADYNRELADWYVFEGIDDLNFAFGKRGVPSTRLNDYEKKFR